MVVEQCQAQGRIPSGDELRQRFEHIRVEPHMLVSAAERAWLYGDAAEAERAAREASAGVKSDIRSMNADSNESHRK
jgi:hypothetical protein